MLRSRAGRAVNFAPPDFFCDRPNRMDQSERIRHLEEQAKRYVSRSKCVDSSLRTLVVQSKASKTSAPASVALSCGVPAASYAAVVPVAIPGAPYESPARCGVATGKGTNSEYVGILQAKQGCAVCSTDSQGGTITLPVPCVDMNAPPFTQQRMDAPYIPPCKASTSEVFFPPKIYDGPGCTYTRITTPS